MGKKSPQMSHCPPLLNKLMILLKTQADVSVHEFRVDANVVGGIGLKGTLRCSDEN